MFSRSRRGAAAVLAGSALALGAVVLPTSPAQGVPGSPYTLTILHHNDGESQLISASGQPDYGGVARFKTLADQLKFDADPTDSGDFGSIMITAGDNFLAGPELSASFEPGAPFYDAIALRDIGYDAMVIGNHDFDFGPDVLERFVNEVNGGSETIPFLSANLDFSGEPGLDALVASGLIAPSVEVVEDGHRIGIIGATTENLPSISSPRNVIVNAVAGAVQAEIDALQADGVEIIILSAHLQGLDEDIALISQLQGLDVAVAGGGDELLSNGEPLVPGDAADGRPYPVVATDLNGENVPLVTSAGDYKYIGKLVVDFDADGNVTGATGGPVRVTGAAGDADAVAEDAGILADVTTPVSNFTAGLGANVIGVSEVALNGVRDGGIRTQETNLGNLVADSFRWQADQLLADFGLTIPNVDVAVGNGGGIRNNNVIPAGDITELTTFDILPFSNFLSVLEEVPRETFLELLENAYSNVEGVDGRFAHLSGASVVYDPGAAPGSRVLSAQLDDGTPIVEDGAVVAGDPISLATVDFLARGGDDYPLGGLDFTVLGTSYQQGLFNYITADPADGGLGGRISAADYPEGGEGRISTPSVLTIPEIQGGAHLSPFVGQQVETTGIVTAVGFRSFFLQDPNGDGDDNTSDGIFVSSRDTVAVGDEVTVLATVEENIGGGPATGNLSVTRLVPTRVTINSSGNAIPAPVVIGSSGRVPPNEIVISDSELPTNLQTDPAVFNPDVDGIDFYEALEGMYVLVEQPQAVSAVRTFNSFSSEFVTVANDGADVAPADVLTARGGIALQPDNENPERVQIQLDGTIYPDAVPAVSIGDRFEDITGVVGYSFGNFEVFANTPLVLREEGANEAETTKLVGSDDEVTIASYNVLNLSGDGTDTTQLETLGGHIADNLGSPDVVALQEIQDNSGEIDDGTVEADESLQALVDAIVAAGGPTYEAFDVAPEDGAGGGIPGGNIRNAFLYNPDRVDLIGFESLTDEPAFDGTRDPLVAAFEFDGDPFVVVNNHFTSRFGSTPIFGGVQPFVQAGSAERAAQAQAINDYVDGVLEFAPDAKIVVTGDMNTFQWTDEMVEVMPGEEPVLTNLIDGLTDDEVYTFVFDGNSQALDHAFVSDSLLGKSELDIVHVNVDFPRVDDSFGSDHEPLVIKLSMADESAPEVRAALRPIWTLGGIGKFQVRFACTDDVEVESCDAELNGIPVHDGDRVLLVTTRSSKTKSLQLGHTLLVFANSFELVATGVDTSGNEATASAMPDFGWRW